LLVLRFLMVKFLPFHGTVPVLAGDESIDSRVSPPYDVISKEQLAIYQTNELNVTNITLGGTDGDYSECGRRLSKWLADGKLSTSAEPCYYLYEQEFEEKGTPVVRIGLVGILAAEGYSPEGVIPHEETFSKVKDDRLNLLKGTETHCESIFGLVDSLRFLSGISFVKLFEFTDDGKVLHRLSKISDKGDISKIGSAIEGKRMLIADGHHRYETACKYAAQNPTEPMKGFVLTTIVGSDDKGLIIRPTHRLVGGMGMEDEQLLVALSLDFGLSRAVSVEDLLEKMRESGGKDLGIYTKSGMSVLLKPKNRGEGALEGLDTFLCEELIIKPLVHRREGWKIAYEHDTDIATSKTKKGDYDFAILLSPPDLDVIWDVAASDKKMPKKSTYFWPKMWSGLVYYRMRRN
ncbi:MAG: DUF1015 domain-containing protein, partial [Euryarchaeota archaeon]|nr:DUF1015 domain-containing protein [Euryarchaeota archaeon]